MNRNAHFLCACLLATCSTLNSVQAATQQPICQHPDNPLYFLWRGKAVALVTSAEHYGAVLNADFDYIKYFKTLERDGLNYTRIFSGEYVEPVNQPLDPSGRRRNTLAPAPGRFLAPWARSDQPGYAGGGNKFDLDRFNPEYLKRLKAFLSAAGDHGIVVELTFFCNTYAGPVHGDTRWAMHPFNPNNNIQALDIPDRRAMHSIECPQVFPYQRRLVRWLVSELRGYDNLFYEIQNEPLGENFSRPQIMSWHVLGGPQDFLNKTGIPSRRSVVWQSKIARIIAETEKDFGYHHLIAQNVSKLKYAIREDDYAPEVDLLNFHYALPEAVSWNLGHGKIIGFDETGFAGREDKPYRLAAWRFMMQGGGLFNHLDHSFNVGYEDGTDVENQAKGASSPVLRKQIGVLSRFLHSFDLARLRPDPTRITHCPGASTMVLSAGEGAHAIYLEGRGDTYMELRLREGRWNAHWLDPVSGRSTDGETFIHPGGICKIPVPAFSEGTLALRLVRDE